MDVKKALLFLILWVGYSKSLTQDLLSACQRYKQEISTGYVTLPCL